MKRFLTICVVLILGLCAGSRAGYVIDGTLSDWGVTPFADWVPSSSSADYIQMDDQPFPTNVGGFTEPYDFEAIYFDDDLDNLYFAVVTSCKWYDPVDDPRIGDLGLDLDGIWSAGPGRGQILGLEYAIRLVGGTGSVVKDPVWLDTIASGVYAHQNSPWMVDPDSNHVTVGLAAIAHTGDFFEPPPYVSEDSTYSWTTIIEGKVARSLLPVLKSQDKVVLHITPLCGNDAINLIGYVDIPEPATILFVGLGMSLAPLLRRQKRDIN
jgi:hypothetical protein